MESDNQQSPKSKTRAETRDPLEVILTEFLNEIRIGNAPTADDFARRYPKLADQIQELFPLVGNLERWKNDKEIDCLRRSVPKQFPFDTLGEYRLIRELGRGGMGVVFEATHIKSHRSVAIKLLPWRFAADMSVWKDRLQQEAATIAALQHPNIVQIYSFSQDHGYYYYVMQFVEGVGLDKIIDQLKRERRKRRTTRKIQAVDGNAQLTCESWRGFAKIGEQVAVALACAHERGVLHNDIKPSNLLIRPNGQVIVTDFGIGEPTPEDLSNGDERAIGTLRYMAPERLSGPGEPRSDLYSLGVTLYELTTQRPVFDFQKRTKLRAAIQDQRPSNPCRLVNGLPATLEKIILKAMSKRPADRYVSARAMAEDLRRFSNREPIQTDGYGVWRRVIGWCGGMMRSRKT